MSLNEETLYSNNNVTTNSKQIALLKKHFPQCFDKSGNFIQEKMLDIINENDIDLSKEAYSLNWLGKSYARLLTNLPPETLLIEDKIHNLLDENKDSKNLLIRGDNLEVLKHLVNAYSEEVKMIYIDPPYNTGGDGFVYNDNRKFTKEQLCELASIDTEEAERILDFTTSNSNSHSAWLTFIYPRLYIAKELLKNEGVIFISIDENELSQLKLICDEIFGAKSFIENISWNKRIPKNDKGIGNIHEYILVYAKNSEVKTEFLMRKDGLEDVYEFVQTLKSSKQSIADAEKRLKKFYKMSGYDRGITLYNGLTNNFRLWGKINMSWPNADTFGPTYDVLHPKTGKPVKVPDRGWRWKKETFDKAALIVDEQYTDVFERHDGTYVCGSIWFSKDDKQQPSSIKYLDEVEEFLLRSILSTKSDGGVEVESLFNNKGYFSYPKPTKLLKSLLGSVEAKDGDIYLDFFAGSGTTAHSVFSLNAEDKIKRSSISVQLGEATDPKKEAFKAGYKTIFDITKARIEYAAKKIKIENPDYQGDLGFKVFETVEDFRRDITALTLENLSFFDDVVLTDEQYQSLLITWALYDGSLLTDELLDIVLDNYKAHYCNGRLYLLAPHFTTDAIKALLLKLDNDAGFAPHKVVLYGNNFDSAKQRELNEALSNYANKKSLELDIVVRN